MVPEKELVPYEPSLVPPSPWLVLAPHPDDEVIGLGGLLALASTRKISVRVAYVSSGELGGKAPEREKEAQKVAHFLGFSPLFWHLPDRKIKEESKKFFICLGKTLTLEPKTIFLPSFQEFHPDHRATTLLALIFLRALGWTNEIWLYEITRLGEVNRLIDISQFISYKKKALDFYKSQLKEYPYFRIMEALNHLRSYTLDAKQTEFVEGFWVGTPQEIIETYTKNFLKYFEL